jgi:hypothetical protein
MGISMKTLSRSVVCINNSDYPSSLELRKIYPVLEDKDLEVEDIRVIDESGEDYIYPLSYVVDIQVPDIAKKSLAETA